MLIKLNFSTMDFMGNDGNNIFLHISLRPGGHASDFKLVMKSAKILQPMNPYNPWGWNNDPDHKERETKDNPFIKGQPFLLAIRKELKVLKLTVSVASRIATYRWNRVGIIDTIRVSDGIHINQCELYRNWDAVPPTPKPVVISRKEIPTINTVRFHITSLLALQISSSMISLQTGPPFKSLMIEVDTFIDKANPLPPHRQVIKVKDPRRKNRFRGDEFALEFILDNELEIYGTIDAEAKE